MLGREDGPRGRIVVLLREPATPDGAVALAVGRAGAEALVDNLAREWEAKGIAINAIVLAAEEYADSAEQVTGLVLKLARADLAETGQILRLG
jgi:NAD(P)-dependent dehydrogenase (short-subunit alcohol dehydrogenase family)